MNRIVNTMNDNSTNNNVLAYQATRLKELIKEIQECCEERKIYEKNRFGLPYSDLECLQLFNGERYLTVKNISQKLEVTKSRVTKIINDLLEKGMVERVDDPKDSRVKLISLTPLGMKKSEEIDSFHKEIHGNILRLMNDAERKEVISTLELLRVSMESVKQNLV